MDSTGERITVLLVDDNPAVRRVVREFLQPCPNIAIIAEAGDGGSAVDRACQLRPQVVIMDIRMPGLSGMEATKRIKTAVPQSIVIGLSTFNDVLMRKAMESAGASAFVAKEFLGDLPSVITRLASTQTAIRDPFE
jgi:DNA-binding NarL/FixJ family response regulator